MTAEISPKAKLGRNVTVGRYSIIHDNVELGDNVDVGDFCIVGHPAVGDWTGRPLVIGSDSKIRSHSILYEGSTFGDRLSVGHHAMIREALTAGRYLQIGSYNNIEGDATIGDYCCFHSNVHVGRGSVVGHLVWIFPNVVLTNDPLPPSGLKAGSTVGDGAVICTNSVVIPGSRLGDGAFVCAGSVAKGVVPAGAVVAGPRGKVIGRIDQLFHAPTGKRHPWMNHYNAKYPPEALPMIQALGKRLTDGLARKAG